MHGRRLATALRGVLVALAAGGVLAAPAPSGTSILTANLAEAADAPRSARDVIVRGQTDLAAALRIATRPAWDGPEGITLAGRDVALIVDVTPYTTRWDELLVDALFAVETAAGERKIGWRIAALGAPLGARAPQASLLATQLADVTAHQTQATSTVQALTRTLRSLGGRDAAIVYLADWRFEDDHELESLLGTLRASGHTFSVIGSEAAFGRGWNDGFAGVDGALSDAGPHIGRIEGIGRNPFGSGSHAEPWHGGDTAYPLIPWRFGKPTWDTEFGTSRRQADPFRRRPRRDAGDDGPDDAGLEDLRERLRGEIPERGRGGLMSRHPLPSAWGPYGLMRLAAETDGHYVLWSWNPTGRSTLRYDYARCDLFPPDLRSRSAIRSDIPSRPLAAATLRAWHTATDRDVGTVTVTPPLARDLRGAREMMDANVQDGPQWGWSEPSERDRFVKRQEKALAKLGPAVADLDGAIDSVGASPDDVDLRLLADAHLLAHTLRAQLFGIGEAVVAARAIPDDAWDGENVLISLRPETFVARGADPERVRARFEPQGAAALGERLVAERKMLLERYRGTPQGETAARNEVVGYRSTRAELGDLSRFDSGRNPAGSTGTPPEPTKPTGGPSGGPGGGSGSGGGPATGR